MPPRIIQLFHNRLIHLGIIVVVCVFTYLPILSHTFAYDDDSFFLRWKTPKSFNNVQKFLEGDTPPSHEGNYRPLRTFIYAVEYKLWGENPVGYHAQAIVVNAVIAALVYLIVAAITRHGITAFVTALLFGTHPAHTEAITFTTASMDTIGIALAFASFYLYLGARRVGSVRFYASVVLAILSFFIYEVTLMMPVLMILYRLCFGKKSSGLPVKPTALWYFGAAGYYALMRVLLMDQSAGRPVTYRGGSFFLTMLLVSKFFYQYILALVFPVSLSVFHAIAPGINTFTVSTQAIQSLEWIDIQNLLSFVIVALSLIAVYVYYRTRPIISFSILWFYIAMIPTLNFLPTHSIFAERYLFMASFGYCLLLGSIMTTRLKKTNKYATWLPSIQAGAVLFIVLSYVMLTVLRNNDWKNPAALWTEVTRRAPESPVGWNNLGLALESDGKQDIAKSYYQKAIDLEPGYANAHSNLARILFDRGEYEPAFAEFELAIKADPHNQEFKTNLDIATQQFNKKKRESMSPEEKKAADEIETILTSSRKLVREQDTTGALAMLEKGLVKYPNNEYLLNDAGVIYLSRLEYKKSIEYILRALQFQPDDATMHLNIGNAYLASGEKDVARRHFEKALELEPDNTVAQDILKKIK